MMKTELIIFALLLFAFQVWAEPAPTLAFNPFDRPAWLDENSPVVANSRPQAQDDRLILRATLVAGDQSLAAVGEELLSVGQEIYGFRLLSVSNGAAVFTNGERKIHVRVAADQKDQDNAKD